MLHKNCMTRIACAAGLMLLCVVGISPAFSQGIARPAAASYGDHADLTPGRVGAYRTLQAPYATPVDETYFQTVKLQAPYGVQMAPAAEGSFMPMMPTPQFFGLQIGKVYRYRVTGIRLYPGVEVYPTVEIVDRTHPPAGQELKYPVFIQLTEEDLILAAQGKFVTRIVYIEDPETALPVAETDEKGQGYFEVTPGTDPLAVAGVLGRPVAILRMGGRAPSSAEEADMDFLYNCPAFMHYVTETPVATIPMAPLPEIEDLPQGAEIISDELL